MEFTVATTRTGRSGDASSPTDWALDGDGCEDGVVLWGIDLIAHFLVEGEA
jgi:hypothetical protein